MNIELLITKHPVLYHVAEPGSWPSIERHGLLSTKALLDHFGATPEERRSILSEHRPGTRRHRGILIRDQKPMPCSKLECALKPAGINPQQWFELLNGKVFFWTSPDRLERLCSAYKGSRQLIIAVPTRRMMKAHEGEISLCHINSGAVRMPNHYRSFESFQPVDSFSYSAKKKPVELTVASAVKDIANLACRVYEVGGEAAEAVLYSD